MEGVIVFLHSSSEHDHVDVALFHREEDALWLFKNTINKSMDTVQRVKKFGRMDAKEVQDYINVMKREGTVVIDNEIFQINVLPVLGNMF